MDRQFSSRSSVLLKLLKSYAPSNGPGSDLWVAEELGGKDVLLLALKEELRITKQVTKGNKHHTKITE